MTAPATAIDVAQQLARLSLDLDNTVKQIEAADVEATRKRAAFDLAFSHAFIAGEGSVDRRKHEAVIETIVVREAADIADAVVRHLRRQLDAIKTRIEVGRSYGAAVRAEASLAGSGMNA